MAILHLSSFPIEQVPDLDQLEQRLGQAFAAREFPQRLLAFSQPFTMRPATQQIEQEQLATDRLATALRAVRRSLTEQRQRLPTANPLAALRFVPPEVRHELLGFCAEHPTLPMLIATPWQAQPTAQDWQDLSDLLDLVLWRLPWMKEMTRFYAALEQRHLRAARYLLLTWEPPEVHVSTLVTAYRQAFQRPVIALDSLPSVLPCAYREHATALEPLESGHPWYALLHSFDLQDTWDATSLHPLLSSPFDVAIAIDLTTLPRSKAQRMAEMAYNAARLLASDARLLDTRAQRVTLDTQLMLHELSRQTLHEIQLAVLVGGRTAEELEIHVADIRDRLGARLRLMRAAGCQGELIKLFSQTPRAQIEAPWKPRTQLSQAVGCLAGIVGMHRASATDGVFLGVDALRRAPIFLDLFKNNQAAHMVVLGKSGYGKTVFLNVLAERAAAVTGMQVIGIDAFRNGYRVAHALHGAACYGIGLERTINILDIVFGDDTEGGWLPNQVLHVVGQLSLLLGQPGQSPDGKKRYLPRTFSPRERGVLARAVTQVYQQAGSDPNSALDAMPILGDLLASLEQAADPIASELALDLRYLLYGTDQRHASDLTPEGHAFNGHTMIDWQFSRDLLYYDFSSVPELLLAFYYLQAIGAVNRYLRRPGRSTQRKIFLLIDEFGYAAQVEAVARLAVDICKTARKYGVGIVLVDQNPLTFLESESGRQIYENAAGRVLFHLDEPAARQIGAAMSDLTSEQVAFLSQAQPGECLTVIKNDVTRVNIELHPLEIRAFVGS